MQRKIYLAMCSRKEAQTRFLSHFAALRTQKEDLPVRQSIGRVTAAPVHARFSSPSFHAAAMDGLAVQAEKTFGTRDDAPRSFNLAAKEATLVNTGYPLPTDTNAVIMIEQVLLNSDNSVATIRSPVFPWQHVRKVGEDIVATELLFPSGHQIRPADIAALITGGCETISVYKKPTIIFLPTGNELVQLEDCQKGIPIGKTIESNTAALAALAEEGGATSRIMPIVADEYKSIRDQILALLPDVDVLVINAGSSAGSADYSVRILEELGEVLVHGVTIMPGKPTILAVVQGKPVIGIPGYPVSAIIAMEQFVLPLLAKMQGLVLPEAKFVRARLARDLPSQSGIEEFRRVVVGNIGEYYMAVPLKKGAGAITTLTKANGMLHIDAASEGEKQGKEVQIELLAPIAQVKRTILCIGSHDLCLDLINDLLGQHDPAYHLASSHTGSLGGIMALKQALCHVAGSHLLDPEDGSYNTSYVRRYLSDFEVRLVTLVYREQGFIVPKGNPKNIRGIADLAGTDVQFINRQSGSGTRVLFDYALKKDKLSASEIKGYDEDEYTHMAVAVAVLSGKADTGLGIRSAANALGLDFVPLVEERYDLIIPEIFAENEIIQALMEIITSAAFLTAVSAMGGYSTRETGKLVALR